MSYPTSRCWGVNVISEFGCREGLFVRVGSYDANNVIVDSDIDQIPFLPANQIAFTHGDTFQPTATHYAITSIDCFDY
jgi:hypothetical protein